MNARKPPQRWPTSVDLLTWLNGRLTDKLTIMHNGRPVTIWTIEKARAEGLTIEDAIRAFAAPRGIDLAHEAEHGPAKPATRPSRAKAR